LEIDLDSQLVGYVSHFANCWSYAGLIFITNTDNSQVCLLLYYKLFWFCNG